MHEHRYTNPSQIPEVSVAWGVKYIISYYWWCPSELRTDTSSTNGVATMKYLQRQEYKQQNSKCWELTLCHAQMQVEWNPAKNRAEIFHRIEKARSGTNLVVD